MKKGILEEAMKNIPEEYKLEALETHNQEAEVTSLNKRTNLKKAVVVAIAASFILALGITAGATGLFGMVLRDPKPNETFTIEYYVYDEEDNETKTIIVDGISKVVQIDGPDKCQAVEFKANYLPQPYKSHGGDFGNPDTWNNYLQLEVGTGSINIYLFYSSELGKDGCLYLQDNVYKESRGDMGEYEVVKLEATPCGDEQADYTNQYLIMYHPDGYVIVIAGTIDMKEIEKTAQCLDVRKTNEIVKYDPNGDHQISLWSGLG